MGPTSEGIIPQPSQDNLRAVGRWLKLNGESIYGAGPTPFGDEPAAAWHCTTKPGKLYIHLFKWPDGSFAISKVTGRVKKAYLLADAGKTLKVHQEGERVTVSLPKAAPDRIDSVLVLVR